MVSFPCTPLGTRSSAGIENLALLMVTDMSCGAPEGLVLHALFSGQHNVEMM